MSNPAEGNHGVNALAKAIQSQMKRNMEAHSDLVLDFGVIQDDYSLLTNTFPVPIPKSDYMVCRHLTIGVVGGLLTNTVGAGRPGDGTHSHGSSGSHGGHITGSGDHSHQNEGPHMHSVLIPASMRQLQPGDRVLVAWVQNDAVVVDLVLPASVL